MGTRFCLAAALVLLSNVALADHAVPLDPEILAAESPAAPPTAGAARSTPESASATPNVKVALPSELDVYLVPAATREVCDTIAYGGGDARTECRTEPLPVRAENPALRGLCITRYGRRTCY